MGRERARKARELPDSLARQYVSDDRKDFWRTRNSILAVVSLESPPPPARSVLHPALFLPRLPRQSFRPTHLGSRHLFLAHQLWGDINHVPGYHAQAW